MNNDTQTLLAFADTLDWQPIDQYILPEFLPSDPHKLFSPMLGKNERGHVRLVRYEFTPKGKGRWIEYGSYKVFDWLAYFMPIPTGSAGAVIRESVRGLLDIIDSETCPYATETAQEALTRAASLINTATEAGKGEE